MDFGNIAVAAAGCLLQVAIGYVWKRSVEAKDEKIERLEQRVDEMDVRRIANIEGDVAHAAESRRDIYRRLDSLDRTVAISGEKISQVAQKLPSIETISERLSATAATLEKVSEQVAAIEARQYEQAQRAARGLPA